MTTQPDTVVGHPYQPGATPGPALPSAPTAPAQEGSARFIRLACRALSTPAATVALGDGIVQGGLGLAGSGVAPCGSPLLRLLHRQVALAGAPLAIADVRTHALVREGGGAAEGGIIAYAGVPLVTAAGEVLGSCGVTDTRVRAWTGDEVAILRELTGSVVAELELHAAVREARHSREVHARQAARASALAEAAQTFAEASLDLTAVLEIVTRRIVELVGDVCVIRLLSGDGRLLEPAAMYHPDAEALAFMREMVTAVPEGVDEGLNGWVMRTGAPLLLPTIKPQDVRPVVKPEWWPYLERFGAHSVVIVPLRVGGRVIGVLSTSRETPGRPYTPDDQTFLQDLGDRAARTIDNARLYREAQEAIRARDQFLSIASHELRTPVTKISGYAELLLGAQTRELTDPERSRRHLRAIMDVAKHLVALTRDLLDVSHLSKGQLVLRPQPVELTALVTAVVTRYRDQLHESHRLAVAATGPCPVAADGDRIEQVLTNLLENAVKYSPQGGEIHVTVGPDGDGAVVTVRDHGVGLPAGPDDALFEPFGRATNVAQGTIPGLGLGLYICRDIIERHGGRIWVTSEGEGRGTTAGFRLPTVVLDGDLPPTDRSTDR